MTAILRKLVCKLVAPVTKKECKYIIGDPANPYLKRYYLIPKNRFFNMHLHVILRSDDDRALHDHPWWNLSWIIRGSYRESLPHRQEQAGRDDFYGRTELVYRPEGSWIFRKAHHRHRLVKENTDDTWTIFITGPVFRKWGFYCQKGWIPHEEFVDESNPRLIGKGCA